MISSPENLLFSLRRRYSFHSGRLFKYVCSYYHTIPNVYVRYNYQQIMKRASSSSFTRFKYDVSSEGDNRLQRVKALQIKKRWISTVFTTCDNFFQQFFAFVPSYFRNIFYKVVVLSWLLLPFFSFHGTVFLHGLVWRNTTLNLQLHCKNISENRRNASRVIPREINPSNMVIHFDLSVADNIST